MPSDGLSEVARGSTSCTCWQGVGRSLAIRPDAPLRCRVVFTFDAHAYRACCKEKASPSWHLLLVGDGLWTMRWPRKFHFCQGRASPCLPHVDIPACLSGQLPPASSEAGELARKLVPETWGRGALAPG